MTVKSWWVLASVNGAATVIAMTFSVLLIVDPGIALPQDMTVTAGVHLYARACAVRTLALGAAVLYLLARRSARGLVPLLVVTGLIQAADGILHVVGGNPLMTIGAGILAAIPLMSAWSLSSEQGSPATST